MPIRHQVKNEQVELFIEELLKLYPENGITKLFEGDFWTTISIESYSYAQDSYIMEFINAFDKVENEEIKKVYIIKDCNGKYNIYDENIFMIEPDFKTYKTAKKYCIDNNMTILD